MRKKTLIFGTGEVAFQIYNKVKGKREIVGFLDNDVSKWGSVIEGAPVLGNADACKNIEYDEILIGSRSGREVIKAQLISAGVDEAKIDNTAAGSAMTGMRMYLNRWMRDHVPYDVEVKWKYLLSPAFRTRILSAIKGEHAKPHNGRMRIVFICQYFTAWNSMKSLYEAARNDPSVDAYIVALPEKVLHENNSFNHYDFYENKAFDMCRFFDENTINGCDPRAENGWFDLKQLNPDYVVLSRPYDEQVPPGYTSFELERYTSVCYMPYAYSKMIGDGRSVYGIDFILHTDLIFTTSKYYCTMVRRILNGLLHLDTKVEFLGFPRFDLYRRLNAGHKKNSQFRKTVLWLPRCPSKTFYQASTFFKHKEVILQYFRDHRDVQLICRPHPFTWKTLLSTGEMTQAEIDEFLNVFKEEPNFVYDDAPDYQPSLLSADIFIADTSSLLIEEFITGNPIIFCGNSRRFDKEAKKWARYMYPVKSVAQLLRRLETLLAGQDGTAAQRRQYIEENLKFDGRAGERILEYLKRDFQSEL